MHRSIHEQDIYAILGLRLHASEAEITRAYRRLAMDWHPDRNTSRDAEERFKRIRQAYETLRDPTRRAEYDRRNRFSEPGPAANPEPPDAERDFRDGARGRDLSRRMKISLAQQIAGMRAKLKISRQESCSACNGVGVVANVHDVCLRCDGHGRVRRPSFPFFLLRGEEIPCETCGGEGRLPRTCGKCEGSGSTGWRSGVLQFDLAPGAMPGSIKRIKGYGQAGRGGRPAGDLLVHIEFEPHSLFQPEFPDLHCTVPISTLRLAVGGEISVPTVEGSAIVPLPGAGSRSMDARVPGAGLLDARSGRRGDLILHWQPVRPERYTAAQRKLIDQLEASLADGDDDTNPLARWARACREAAPAKPPRSPRKRRKD